LFGLLLVPAASAHCEQQKNTILSTYRAPAAKIPFGRVNLASAYLQPSGTLLASVSVPPTSYTHGGASAETWLWRCDKEDEDKLHFLVAVNADARFGGWHVMGGDNVPDGVHATWFDYVGLRLSIGDHHLHRYWRKIELQGYETVPGNAGKEKIEIRLKHLPTLQAELYRLGSPVPSDGHRWDCSASRPPPSQVGNSYECNEPGGYIQLVGPGLRHDKDGEDARTRYDFWGAHNGFGYTLHKSLILSNTPACVTRSASAEVRFPTATIQRLQAGGVEAPLSIEFECNNHAIPGTGSGQTAIGLQVSEGALKAARNLHLVTSEGGVKYLLSDEYDHDPRLAKGVGITLHETESGEQRNFVGKSGTVTGAQTGWYPVLQGAHRVAPGSDFSMWQMDFTAKLVPLPGHTITPGKVHASATVQIKVQ